MQKLIAMYFGPYCIDYSYNDDTRDIYTSTGTNEVKFNSIENITIYNQDKVDIKELGGSFKIAYSYNGAVTEENEGKLHRISDDEYYTMADYEEISGFTSLKPFYIVVYRGTMKPEDFKGFYAKIDFQYLKDLKAEIVKYEAHVIRYFYTEEKGGNYSYVYSGSKLVDTTPPPDPDGYTYPHRHESRSVATSISVPTVEFKLHREEANEEAQDMVAYLHNGKRTYDTYSIVLKSIPSDIERGNLLKFGIYKETEKDGEALYGAKFDVTVEAIGENLQGELVNKKVKFSRTTNVKGMITISNATLSTKGLDLTEFTGDLYASFVETKAPAGCTGLGSVEMHFEIECGKIVGADGSDDIDWSTYKAYSHLTNDRGGTPAIQLAKVNPQNEVLKEAYFDVYVSYTETSGVQYNSDGTVRKYGKLVDYQQNLIKGQTTNGYLNLTVEDFKNMPKGFDITNYTGKLTLRITEAGVSADGYSISSDSISVTLEYLHGTLVEYTENTNGEVMVHYLYDDPLENIYKWAKGEAELYPYIKDAITSWAKTEQNRTGKSYEDVLAWLVEYIEKGGKGTEINMDEWVTSTYNVTTKGYDGDRLVQIVVEDKPGTYGLPNIPDDDNDKIYKRNYLTMTLGGTVFLDQTTTKDLENESDGKLGEDEDLLEGIQVTLYEEDGTIATLIQEEGAVRTNPTITNEDGYYEFNGIDPMKKYYVVFTYNGIEYRATTSGSEAKYGSSDWEVTSKAGEISSGREQYKTITANTKVYDYYELKGIYNEITNIRKQAIAKNRYPSWDEVASAVIENHPDDKEIQGKIEYIENCQTKAKAGYSHSNTNGVYPHEDVKVQYATNVTSEIVGKTEIITTTISFAGETISLLYPSQLQVHLGLVERDSTDLELISDVVETNVSINGYDTKYAYAGELSSYHQYIFAEDYNYATAPNNSGIAYYTEDNVHFYITYEIVVTNTTNTPAQVREIVNYYNSEFRWKNSYTTTKGNTISGLNAWYNGQEIPVEASGETRYGKRGYNDTNAEYKQNYIRVGDGYDITDGDKLVIHVTYELVGETNGDAANAREVLKKYLLTEESSDYSRSWVVGNISEINAYYTSGGYIDTDSHPGNFVIADYEKANEEYRKAYSDFVKSGFTEDAARNVKLAMARLAVVREDDAWKINLTLTNNLDKRTISGSVAEFVNDQIKTSLDLQKEYDNGERYVLFDENYIREHNLALEGITVELVEIVQNGEEERGANQIVRAVTKTDQNGNYEFSRYIAGNYTIRFVYGDYNNQDKTAPIYSKISKNTYETQENADYLPINRSILSINKG